MHQLQLACFPLLGVHSLSSYRLCHLDVCNHLLANGTDSLSDSPEMLKDGSLTGSDDTGHASIRGPDQAVFFQHVLV